MDLGLGQNNSNNNPVKRNSHLYIVSMLFFITFHDIVSDNVFF